MKQIISVIGAGGKTTFVENASKHIIKYSDVLVSTTTKMMLPNKHKYDYLIIKQDEFDMYDTYFKNCNVIEPSHTDKKDSSTQKLYYLLNNQIEAVKNSQYILLKNKIRKVNKKYDLDTIKKCHISYQYYHKKYISTSKNINFQRYDIYYFLTNVSITNTNKKFMHISDNQISSLTQVFDYIILEADGARGKSLKYPKTTEPVISSYTTKSVYILDISMIGKTIDDDNIYNCSDFVKNTKTQYNQKITPQILLNLILDKNGAFKNSVGQKVLYINKVSTKSDYQNLAMLKDTLKNTDIKIIKQRLYTSII